MESVALRFPVSESIAPGAMIVVFGDDAGGAVDFATPVSEAIPAWPPTAHRVDWLNQSFLETRFLQATASRGFLEGLFGEHPFLEYEDTARYVGGALYGPKGVGPHTFAAMLYDERGRASGSSPPEVSVAINTFPRPASAFEPTEYAGGRMVFSFTPSPDL